MKTVVHSEETPVVPPLASQQPSDLGLTEVEIQSIENEKLASIRAAIEKGAYDSDAILELALIRMLERIEESEIEQ